MYDGGIDERLLQKLEQANQQIGRLEERMAAMVTLPAPVATLRMNLTTFEQFMAYVKADNFIEAIRLVRSAYGLDLKAAKDLVILAFPSRRQR